MQTVPMTPLGFERATLELEKLKTVDRHDVIRAITEARAHGDLKENAEYHAAKEQQSFIEGRIADLEGKLSRAQVIDISKMDNNGRVIFGATVTLRHCETQNTVTYQIVGEDEADINENKVSVGSPLARAMIGKSLDDEIEVHAPEGEQFYEIIAVDY